MTKSAEGATGDKKNGLGNENGPREAKNAVEKRWEPKEGTEGENKGPGVEETGVEAAGDLGTARSEARNGKRGVVWIPGGPEMVDGVLPEINQVGKTVCLQQSQTG